MRSPHLLIVLLSLVLVAPAHARRHRARSSGSSSSSSRTHRAKSSSSSSRTHRARSSSGRSSRTHRAPAARSRPRVHRAPAARSSGGRVHHSRGHRRHRHHATRRHVRHGGSGGVYLGPTHVYVDAAGGPAGTAVVADGPAAPPIFDPPCLRHTVFLDVDAGGGGLASSFARGGSGGMGIRVGYRTPPLGSLALELDLAGGFQALAGGVGPAGDPLLLARMTVETRLYLRARSALQPYLQAGVGIYGLNRETESYSGPGFNAGGGLLYWFHDHFALDFNLVYDAAHLETVEARGVSGLLGLRLYL